MNYESNNIDTHHLFANKKHAQFLLEYISSELEKIIKLVSILEFDKDLNNTSFFISNNKNQIASTH